MPLIKLQADGPPGPVAGFPSLDRAKIPRRQPASEAVRGRGGAAEAEPLCQ